MQRYPNKVVNHSLIGQAESVWVATTPDTNYPSLATLGEIDVAVIGGGITGLTTAHLLREGGASVAIIEANEIVKGVTGYTTGKVTSQHRLIYDYLIGNFGLEQARMYGQANQAGLAKIAEWVATKQILCDFKRTTAYVYAQTDHEHSQIEKEYEAAQQLGLPAAMVTDIALPLPIKGAISFTDQAQFHPRKYLLALAQSFVANGGNIFEHTRVLEIEAGSPCTIKTAAGTLTAKSVVVATNVPIYDPALYFTRLTPHRSCVVAVKLNGPVPEGMFIGVDDSAYSFRNQPTDDGLLFFIGGEGYKTGQGGDVLKRYEALTTFAKQHFDVASVSYHWSTQDNKSVDRVPFVGPIAPQAKQIFVATGFGGWGMTNGTAAGIILSDQILGRENQWAEVFNPQRFKPAASAKQFVAEGLDTAKELLSGVLPKPSANEIQSLPHGEGKVFSVNHERVAISRDMAGNLHSVSAVCSHLGCIVAWNNGEQSWDCPCHGSRFDQTGNVLHGPAVNELEQKSLNLGTT